MESFISPEDFLVKHPDCKLDKFSDGVYRIIDGKTRGFRLVRQGADGAHWKIYQNPVAI